MAIYYADTSYISRNGAGSVCSHSAYISASIAHDQRTGMTWDYSGKAQELLATNIIAPEGSPEWVYDHETLWNRVEEFEDYIADKRYKGHKDEVKNAKSLAAKEKFLKTCKTGYKLTFALPLEITNKEHLIELSERLVKECYVAHGLVTQYAIHDKKGNPHLHILATTRPLVDEVFSEKRHVIEKPQLKILRSQLAKISNQFAQEKGYDYHLDPRSYEDQGLKVVPTKKIGPHGFHKLQERSYKVQENEEIRHQNIEIFLKHPEELIKIVASQKAVFTQVDLAKEIFKRVAGDEKLYAVLKAKVDGIDLPKAAIIGKTLNDNLLYESKSLQFNTHDYSRTIDRFTAQLLSQHTALYLGENVKGQTFYTSQEMKDLETTIAQTVDLLKQRKMPQISEKHTSNSIEKVQKQEGLTFTQEQREAIDHLLIPQAISVLTGKAGTGKSTVLKPVVDAYQKTGMTVIGVAFQGKVADQLSYELGIEGYTLDQLKKRWSKQDNLKRLIENKELKGQALAKAKAEVKRLQEWRFSKKHVVILDEGSMVSGSLWSRLLQEVERSGAQLRIVQDNKQIKALEGLDATRLVEEKVGAYEIQGVVRQREKWMREASALLNEHSIEEGLKPYDEKGHFDYRETDYGAKISLVADYLEGLEKNPHQTHMAIAQKNKDVIALNELIRGALSSQGKLGSQEFVFGQKGQGIFESRQDVGSLQSQYSTKSAQGRRFAVGDRVMFLSNDHKGWHVKTLEKGKSEKQGVKNGTLGVLEAFDLKRQTVEIRLPDGRLVGFDTKGYDDALTHGYAVTINKSQGATFDHSYGLFSSFNANQLLIWLTRHKESFKGYVSKGIASDLKGMVSHVARADYKGLSTDYDLPDHQKPYFNLVQQYWKISQEAGNLRVRIEEISHQAEKAGKEVSLADQWEQYKSLIEARNQGAKGILKEWPQCSSFLQQTGVRREVLEVQAGLKQRLLSSAEEASLEKVEVYFKVADQVRDFWKDISQTHPGSLSYEHPEYNDYAKVKEIRNEMAYEMASFPQLYKPFFKVQEQGESYVTYSGTLYEQRPQSFKAVLAQAEQYIAFKRVERYESTLTFHERTAYKQVQDYRSFHHMSVAAYKQLPELEKIAASPAVVEAHQQKMKEFAGHRDKLAYDLLSNYDQASPFIEKLGLKEEMLLKHAVFGEVRGIVEAYKTADTLEARVQMADKLVSFVFKEEGGVDKPLYGLLKEQGVDLQKLKFEQGCLKAQQQGKDLSIHNLDELDQVYTDLSTYRSLHQEVAKEWEIIKTSATQKVTEVQEQQIKTLNLLETTNKLERSHLEEEAISALKLKASNTQTLAYINNHIRLTVNGVENWSDLKEEVQGRQLELDQFHTSLQKGRSGYVEIYTRGGQTSSWSSLRTQKLEKAKSLMRTYSNVHHSLPHHEYDRLFKEAHAQEMTEQVRHFKQASPQEKPKLAQEIQEWLSLEQDERLTYTLTALKQEKVSVETLHLYEKILALPLEKQGDVSLLLEGYSEAKQRFSDIWQGYSEQADLKLAGEKVAYQEHVLALEAQLHAKNAKYNPHLFVERTIQRTTHALKKAKLTSQDWTSFEKERDGQNAAKEALEHKVQIWIEKGAQTYGWNLNTPEQGSVQKEIISLALKQNDLFEKKLNEINQIIKSENQEIPRLAIAAGKRNKAAFDLIQGGFVSQNQEVFDPSLRQVKDQALRYACSSYRLQKIHERDPEKFKDHAVVLFLKDQLSLGDEKVQGRIQKALDKAGLTLDGHLIEQDERRLIPGKSQAELSYREEREAERYTEKKGHPLPKAYKTPLYDKEDVLSSLTKSHIEEIFARHIDLWVTNPKPTYRSHEIRYGSKGGFVIYRDQSTWSNFKTGEGGDIFNYVSKSLNISYKDAIKQIGEEINAPQLISINWEERAQKHNELKLQAEIEEKAKIEKSQATTKNLYDTSHPIQGTLAEQYLREHRKIETAKLPQDLRFIPEFRDYDSQMSYPALVAFARDAGGKLTSAQVTCLDPDTAHKADIDVKKRSVGSIKGTAVEIQSKEGPTYVAEGVETALSLKEAGANGRILVSLGLSNMRNVGSHIKDKGQPVILCCDADEVGSPAWKSSEQNLKKLQEEGFKASIIRPQGGNGRDFNDILQEEGIAAVQSALKDVALFKERLSQKETLFPQHTPLHASETEIISPELGKSAETQEEIKSPYDKLNFLELFLECKDKLQKLPSFIEANKDEKPLVMELNQQERYHAHQIWKNESLKHEAYVLGLEEEIKKKARFYQYDLAWSVNYQESKQDLSSQEKDNHNALEHYLMCKEKLQQLPNFIEAQGDEKSHVMSLNQEARKHAYDVWNDKGLKQKAQSLGLEEEIKKKAQIHQEGLEKNIKYNACFKQSW
ncbi:hypothetical protein IM40_11480 (plasmid) [Candidatus Paracaedimonas acanthamoebae]|nr:hypothetical protein IM40_11480 [Candidatus Paracaedimonas acanthamoebae]